MVNSSKVWVLGRHKMYLLGPELIMFGIPCMPVLLSFTICRGGLLVWHEHGSKLLQLGGPDDAIQVHLLQDAVGGQLLTALVLE